MKDNKIQQTFYEIYRSNDFSIPDNLLYYNLFIKDKEVTTIPISTQFDEGVAYKPVQEFLQEKFKHDYYQPIDRGYDLDLKEIVTTQEVYINKDLKVIVRLDDITYVKDNNNHDKNKSHWMSYTCSITFDSENEEAAALVKEITDLLIAKVVTYRNERTINIITQNQSGFNLSPITIKTPLIDLDINYGPDFRDIHEVVNRCLLDDRSGLLLFRGEPGTGKTNYLRYLLSNIDKEFIFLPPNMVSNLSSPSFVTFLLEQKGKILVIEDAELALMDREASLDAAGGVSNLLNITDGLLGDGLELKIIATQNKDKDLIDEAFKRKGRLLVDYEFFKLDPEYANKLGKDLKIIKEDYFTEPVTLADIYNLNAVQIESKVINKNKIGFK